MGASDYHHFLIVLVVLLGLFGFCFAHHINTTPAFFVFGDSSVDVGNNNYIPTLAKTNYYPYGIDFGKPTGRSTNGRTIIDILGQELGLKDFIPPYLAPTTVGDVIFRGVNYASNAAGILNETGKIYGEIINMDAQLDNFMNTRQDIISRIGASAATSLLEKALFFVSMGANDLLEYYFPTPFAFIPRIRPVSPVMHVETLISRHELQLTRLYNLGARKIVISNVGPIGCAPYLRERNPLWAGDSCLAVANELATLFNNRLKSLVLELSSKLVGSKFVFADAYHILSGIVENYQSYGFENYNSGCCRLGGRFGGLVPCIPLSIVCSNRSKYVFWDNLHPSEAAFVVIAKHLLHGDSNDVYPINIRQLFQEA